jgi:predicted permease
MSDSSWRRLRRIVQPSVRQDVDDEMAFHFQMRVAQFMESGMSRADAERAARERFGDMHEVQTELVDIDSRRRRRLDLRERFDATLQDLTVSARSLRREPLFALGVILTIALGIGANATMFGVIDRLLVRGPALVADASRVNKLFITRKTASGKLRTSGNWNYLSYTALRDNARSFSAVAAYGQPGPALFGPGREARPVQQALATWDLFPLLGVRPLAGRFFTREEDSPPAGTNVAVIAEEMWRAEFGRDPMVLGKPMIINGASYTIVGVAPQGFTGPQRMRVDVWLPMTTRAPRPDWPTTWQATWLSVETRLAPGVTRERAGEEATRILREAYTGPNAGMRELVATLRPLSADENGQPSRVVSVARWLMGVAVIVLIVTCANVANLIVARGRRRRREVAVRLALGAGRWRVARLLFAETVILVGLGTAVGLLITVAGSRVMQATLLENVAWDGRAVDARVFAFTAGVALATALLIGLLPALDATGVRVTGALKETAGSGGGRRSRGRLALSALQAAMCVVLLAGAGLFARSLMHARGVRLGFEANRVVRANPWFDYEELRGPARADGKARAMLTLQSVAERFRAMGWVEHAAISVGSPFGFDFAVTVKVPGRDSIPALAGGGPYIAAVTSDYFATVGTPLRTGRLFTPADRDGSAPVAIINETMAATLWPGESALGKCLLIGDGDTVPCASVVGVVADVHRASLREPPSMQYYIPFGQERGFGGAVLMVRARSDADAAAPLVKRALLAMPDMPYTSADPIQAAIDPEYRPWQLGAAMFGVFGLLALIIAVVGLYSVIAYLVSERTRELGVRIALGATSGRIVRGVVLGGALVLGLGIAAGTVVVLATGRYVEPLLFDVKAHDPTVLGAVGSLVLAIGLFASWWPARRASRVDPVIALRAD